MPGSINPWDVPEWHAIGREAALVRHLIGSGVTALGRANYANSTGEYYTAFFGLSVGLERLTKLILVADYVISHGRMPEERVVRKFGHKLADLMDAADEASQRDGLQVRFPRPASSISVKVIECLDAFADAGRGRYANFAAIGDPNLGHDEPIRRWWGEVAELILREHYYGKQAQGRVEARAKGVDTLMSPFATALFINEVGDVMRDVLSSSIRTGQTALVQRYGRFYALTNVRWLADVFSELCRLASYRHSADAFFGMWEYFETYTVDDSFLKTRKIWPLS